MMHESGRVVAIDKDALWVETIRRSTCGTCAAQKGCGQGLLNRIGDGRRNHIRVLLGSADSEAYQLNDEVIFSVPEHVLLRGAVTVYLLPLLCMIGGMALADRWLGSELMAALGALLGFAAGLGAVRWHAWLIRNNPDYQPRVISQDSASPGREPLQLG